MLIYTGSSALHFGYYAHQCAQTMAHGRASHGGALVWSYTDVRSGKQASASAFELH